MMVASGCQRALLVLCVAAAASASAAEASAAAAAGEAAPVSPAVGELNADVARIEALIRMHRDALAAEGATAGTVPRPRVGCANGPASHA